MTWTLQASTIAQSTSGGSGLTAPINTLATGGGPATAIFVSACYAIGSAPVLADFLSGNPSGNTFNPIVTVSNMGSGAQQVIFISENPAVDSSHTFSLTAASSFASIAVASFRGSAGTALFDTGKTDTNSYSGAATTSMTIGAGGGFTPSGSGRLCIFGWGALMPDSGVNVGVVGGAVNGIILQSGPLNNGVSYAIGIGYLIQTVATLFDPTIQWVHSATNITGVEAAFMPNGAGAGSAAAMYYASQRLQ